ncbi:hypothetical protein C5167_023152 [Papaver somniferum]|uniref:Uncharacterized protein n=1 Tax=Papaver somniferum TaxID=3469 RepID=A0A4Y7JJV7_PAPSO|nr:hypothetical protein C5167_023152 [Papaver somniferum]
MRALGEHPDHNVFPSVLKSCTGLMDFKLGEAVHGSWVYYFDSQSFSSGSVDLVYEKIPERKFRWISSITWKATSWESRCKSLSPTAAALSLLNQEVRRCNITSHKTKPVTPAVMKLLNDAVDILGYIHKAAKGMISTMPMIHIYGFSNALDPEVDFQQRIRIALKEVLVEVDMHMVRHGTAGKLMLCASFVLPEI